ncbi:nipped-B-like protein [Actinia tenebrosa]|nr:nipped-B-like protein [Actinia tenebrosa]
MQVYLKDILQMFFHRQSQLRTAALTVVTLILRQGLVHPVQCVPYLIAAGTDVEQQTRLKSDQQLTDIDNKYSGFIQMKALAGTKMSFDLQKLIHEGENEPIRGFRKDTSTSLLSHMYSVVRTSRQPRRSLLQALLRMFDDHKKSKLDLLLYVTDNLAYFPYSVQEEPLFIMHHIDTMLSVSGAHLLQAFKEIILPKTRDVKEGVETSTVDDDDDDATVESVIARIPEDNSTFAQHCHSAQKSLLLLLLKEHLKELFGLTDSKCHKYSPSAPSKAYDKTVSRKPGTTFQPEQVIDYVCYPNKERPVEELAKVYCEFKGLMIKLDPQEEDSDDSNGRDSPAVDLPPVLDAEGNVIVKPVVTPKPKVKQRKTPAKGRKTPPVSAKKGKPKPKKKRKKITLGDDSDVDEGDLDPDFK